VLPGLLDRGLTLVPRTVALRLERDGRQLTAVRCFDKDSGAEVTYRARWFVLAAGALASPHLALASGLDELNPAGEHVGRYLMRHANAIVFGLFPRLPGSVETFHKQVAFHDFYFGHPGNKGPAGKLGCIQQLSSPPIGLVRAHLPRFLGAFAAPFVRRMTGLLVMAEDQPSPANRVRLSSARTGFGMPQLEVRHAYSRRDLAACKQLQREARRILRRAGAWLFYTHQIRTFSHAVGTLRLGRDPLTSPVDADYRFRGVDNLSVVDGSVMPTSAGLNPSLTISANALRAGEYLATSGALA
jgi:choline dehydrogenase-like flavoprotein